MTHVRVWLSRLGGLFRRGVRDRALSDEVQSHLDELTDDLVDAGLSREEATREARRRFGGIDLVKERYRDQRGWPIVDTVARDLKLALRLLCARPASTALAIGSLGLGIGVSVAFFTLVNAMCLRGLPIEQPDRVLFVTTQQVRENETGALSYADFIDLERDVPSIATWAAYIASPMNLADDRDAPARLSGTYISASGFRVLTAAPALGRDFEPADDAPGAEPVAIISYAVWQSRYGASRSAIGQVVRVDGRPATIVGVMGDGFRFPSQADIWMPLGQSPQLTGATRSARGLSVLGRLSDMATPAMIDAELDRVSRENEVRFPDANRDIRFRAEPVNEHFNGRLTDPVWTAFLTAGTLVLLIACANVANLLLARLDARSREVALRLAIGATRGRILAQFLVESLVLAVASGVVGLTLAFAAVRLLAWTVPAESPLPYWISFTVDLRVLTVLVVTCMASILVFGLIPAVHGSRVNVNERLKDGGRHGTGARRTRRWTTAFLALEFALTLVLLTNLSMTVRREFVSDDPGVTIDAEPLLTAQVTLPASYDSADARRLFYDRIRDRLLRVRGVVAMTTSAELPEPSGETKRVRFPDHALAPGERDPEIRVAPVDARFFETIGLRPIAGRDLTDEDGLPGHEGTNVNQQFVRQLFGGTDALGRRIQIADDGPSPVAPPWLTVVGVVPDLREGAHVLPRAYVSNRRDPAASRILVLRTATLPESLGPAIRQAVAELDADLPLHRVMPLSLARYDGQWNGRASSSILLTCVSSAMTLAFVGLYAVTMHAVVERTAEIGIRVALGATRRRVWWLVLRRSLRHVAIGIALGLPLTWIFERQFTDTSSTHQLMTPANLAVAIGLVLIATVTACAWPATRASRLDPAQALRTN